MSCPNTLLKAVTAGRTRQVRLLLELGASTEEQDDCGQTPLIRAVLLEHDRNREKILRILLKRGAVVSKVDVVGRNALMWACLYGRDTDVALLIQYVDVDMDFNQVDINGQTALFHAVTSGNAATVKLLVSALMKYGLSTDTPDSHGTTPLMRAQRLGHDVCESILIYEGNAKIGLSGISAERLKKREKWAVSSLRDRSKAKISKSRTIQSQFPPIDSITMGSPNVSCRRPVRNQTITSDSDDYSSLSEDDSFDPVDGYSYRKPKKNVSSKTKTINTPMLTCLQNLPRCNIPPSVLVVSASSSAGNISSGEESEVDSVASTIVEEKGRIKTAKNPADLTAIYDMKQEQMSTSFRKSAVQVDEPPLEQRSDTPIVKTKAKDVANRKWSMLKRSLQLTALSKKTSKSKKEDKNEDEISASERENAPCRTELPSIFCDKRQTISQRVKTESPRVTCKTPRILTGDGDKNWNYSEN